MAGIYHYIPSQPPVIGVRIPCDQRSHVTMPSFFSSICLSTTMSMFPGASGFTISSSNCYFMQTTNNNQYGYSGEWHRFSHRWSANLATRHRYPPWCFQFWSNIWFTRALRSSLLPWHKGTVYCRHHELGNSIYRHALINVLDEGSSRSREIGHCPIVCWETEKNWTSWCCILLYCQGKQ